jgi:hypothetical protein
MGLWHNQKYENLEKSVLKGDLMRGVPAKNFPWTLKNILQQDLQGSTWEIKTLCLGIETFELSQKVNAKISLEGRCQLTEENLQNIGIEYQRLFDLNLHGWNQLKENTILQFNCPMEKIEEKSEEFSKIFFQKIKKKYTSEKKKEIILWNIKNCKISNFS